MYPNGLPHPIQKTNSKKNTKNKTFRRGPQKSTRFPLCETSAVRITTVLFGSTRVECENIVPALGGCAESQRRAMLMWLQATCARTWQSVSLVCMGSCRTTPARTALVAMADIGEARKVSASRSHVPGRTHVHTLAALARRSG